MALKLKIEENGVGYNNKKFFFRPEKCGHLNDFRYSAPRKCEFPGCEVELPDVHRLYGNTNQYVRVKYFAEGKI